MGFFFFFFNCLSMPLWWNWVSGNFPRRRNQQQFHAAIGRTCRYLHLCDSLCQDYKDSTINSTSRLSAPPLSVDIFEVLAWLFNVVGHSCGSDSLETYWLGYYTSCVCRFGQKLLPNEQ